MDEVRFKRLKREVGEDLDSILEIYGWDAANIHRTYLQRQIDKYLKPPGRGGALDVFDRDIKILRDLFRDKGANLPTWDYGKNWGTGGSFTLFMAFGYSPIYGTKGQKIRLE